GLFELKSGRLARQEMPPLARLGSIEGRLDSKLAGPSASVVLQDGGQYVVDAACGPGDRFTLRDVLPGSYDLWSFSDGRPSGGPVAIRVAPGQRIANVMIGPKPAAPAQAMQIMPSGGRGRPQPRPGGGEEVPLVEGTVRDEQGRGVPGVDVYAHIWLCGGHDEFETIQAAMTDERGRYQVRGTRRQMIAATVVAHAEGRPPALRFGRLEDD